MEPDFERYNKFLRTLSDETESKDSSRNSAGTGAAAGSTPVKTPSRNELTDPPESSQTQLSGAAKKAQRYDRIVNRLLD